MEYNFHIQTFLSNSKKSVYQTVLAIQHNDTHETLKILIRAISKTKKKAATNLVENIVDCVKSLLGSLYYSNITLRGKYVTMEY